MAEAPISSHESVGGTKRIVAWHEAAHAVVGIVLNLELLRVEISENPQTGKWKGRAIFAGGDRVAHAVQLKAGAESELLLGSFDPAERSVRAGGDGDVVETICRQLELDPDTEAMSFHLAAESRAVILLLRNDVQDAIRVTAEMLEARMVLTGEEINAIVRPMLQKEADAFDVETLGENESVQDYLRRLRSE